MFLLEPLSCLLRLALLQFLPEGTKLGIDQSRVYLVPPWRLQSLVRWYSGSSRDDLFFLLRPVVAAKVRFNHKDEDLAHIMLHAAVGLRHLQRTYASEASTAGQCLKLYSQYLTSEAEIDPEDMQTDDFSHQIYSEYKKIWSKEEIVLARGMLDIAKGGKFEYVRALEKILNEKEKRAHDILERLTVSITKKPTNSKNQTNNAATSPPPQK